MKEDYLNYLARLLIHIKELSKTFYLDFNSYIFELKNLLLGAKQRAQGGAGPGTVGPQGNVQQNNPQQGLNQLLYILYYLKKTIVF